MQMKMPKMYEIYARKSETLTERAIKDGSLPQNTAERRHTKAPDYAVGSLWVGLL